MDGFQLWVLVGSMFIVASLVINGLRGCPKTAGLAAAIGAGEMVIALASKYLG